jgi:hypothetical protein
MRGFAMVVRMSDNHVDPSGNTEAFRAFTESPQPEPASSRTPLIIGGVIVLVIIVAVIIWAVA